MSISSHSSSDSSLSSDPPILGESFSLPLHHLNSVLRDGSNFISSFNDGSNRIYIHSGATPTITSTIENENEIIENKNEIIDLNKSQTNPIIVEFGSIKPRELDL